MYSIGTGGFAGPFFLLPFRSRFRPSPSTLGGWSSAGQDGTGDPRLRDPHKAICFAGTP
ncbi:MAG: hypothetical protein IJ687_04355 [Bacteroidales bacterium]|nr:hypothetical protein [Bacteroidales bacterium]